MAPPILKIIEILTDKKTNLISFLNSLDFNEKPHILSLEKFEDTQCEMIEVLSEYFENKKFLYPTYILTKELNYPTQLNLISSKNEAPKFFKQKTKQLNIKENLVFNKIKLKQDQLKNINYQDTMPVIQNYAKNHRDINIKNDFFIYLNQVIKDIRKKHES